MLVVFRARLAISPTYCVQQARDSWALTPTLKRRCPLRNFDLALTSWLGHCESSDRYRPSFYAAAVSGCGANWTRRLIGVMVFTWLPFADYDCEPKPKLRRVKSNKRHCHYEIFAVDKGSQFSLHRYRLFFLPLLTLKNEEAFF